MLIRPVGGRHGVAMRRLPSFGTLATHSTRLSQLPPSRRPLGIDRRLLTTRPELRPWRPRSTHNGIGFLPERTLATALNDYTPALDAGTPLDPLSAAPCPVTAPFPHLYTAPAPVSQTPRRTGPAPLWELRPHNVSSPLVLDETDVAPVARQKISTRGIPGDVDEMLSLLDACLQIGKFERAALVLKRLSRPEFAGAADIDVAELHMRYLRASVDRLLSDPDQAAAEALHKWYELDMRGRRREQSPETIALMLKASLLTARGVRRERLIDRYMSLAPGDAGLEVLYMTGILNDQDRAAITAICRTYNLEPVAPDAEGPSTLFEEALRTISAAAGSEAASAVSAATGTETTADDALHSASQTAHDVPDTADAGQTPEARGASNTAATCDTAATAETAETAEMRTTPEVLSTPQKGMGLRVLKQTLSMFSEIPQGHDIASLSVEERREIQGRLEQDCVDAAVDRWKEENQALLKMGLNTSLTTASLNARLYEWHRDLELRLSQEMKKIALAEAARSKNHEDMDRCLYGPFLQQSSPSRLAAVTIVSALSSLATHGADKGVSIGTVITQIAKVTEEDIRLQQQTRKAAVARGLKLTSKAAARSAAKAAAKTALRRAMRPGKNLSCLVGASESTAAEAQAASNTATDTTASTTAGTTTDATVAAVGTDAADAADAADASPGNDSWPITIKAKVGAALLSMLMETAKVTAVKEHDETRTLISQQQPAFTRLNQLRRGKKVGVLVANTALVDLMKREPRGDFLARHLPMVVEPQPWAGFDKGGFLHYSAPLVRIKDSRKDQKMYAEAAIARGDMDQVLRGLDVLGRTAWRVNRPVFDVMLAAWNKGEAIADIPAVAPDIAMPAEPDSSEDPMKRRSWLKAVKTAENTRSGLHSVRCFMNFQMEIARAFRDQTFYFPHNVDFRGRAYPIPPYFNHMGADHVRGLLTFARGKVLGAAGLRWLQVHVANVYGYDKASLADRAAFAMDNLDNIRDAAADPLGGRRWWLGAEDPWQCLAACFELSAAMALPDPTQYVSHLPVHQDGTCNGLQHYAALGGDSWGARQVNLEPGDRPADVYSAVADIVRTSIAEDAARGDPHGRALDGLIKRKVVKQTVMTNVYGVTFAGARKQVLKQLDALYPELAAQSGIAPIVLASYIATKIFQALSTMFGGAHDIQNWLGEIGGRVCRALTPDQVERIVHGEPATDDKRAKARTKATRATKTAKAATGTTKANDELLGQFRSTLVWTTPLQMPVVQPYRKAASRTIETCLQDLILSVPARSDPVHKRKQLQAFPPNFIHSLDASHMLLSALECDALGLQFAAVHDSFWTHAADVDTMNRVLRDAFVRIHSEDVVGRLAREFEARYKGSLYLAQVSRTSAVAKKILAWRKKTPRRSLRDELVLEHRRLQLLASDDPACVAEGRAMVTPASIFAKASEQAPEPEAAIEAAIEAEDLAEFSLGRIPEEEAKKVAVAAAAAATAAGGDAAGKPRRGRRAKADTDDVANLANLTNLDNLDNHDAGSVTNGMDLDGMGSAMGDVATGDDVAASEGLEDELVDDDDADVDADAGHFEATLRDLKKPTVAGKTKRATSTSAAATAATSVRIWVPLTFPAIPAKGDFDVRRLRDSDYFFS